MNRHLKPLRLREIACQTHPLSSRNSPAGEESGEPLAAALFVFFADAELNADQGCVTTRLSRSCVQQAVPRARHTEFDNTVRTRPDISRVQHDVIVSRPSRHQLKWVSA